MYFFIIFLRRPILDPKFPLLGYSTSKSSTVGSQRFGMDIEEGWIPYSPKEEFVEGRSSIRHKRSSGLLGLEDSVRKCREDN